MVFSRIIGLIGARKSWIFDVAGRSTARLNKILDLCYECLGDKWISEGEPVSTLVGASIRQNLLIEGFI